MENESNQQLTAGTKIASYVVRRKIGSGGMGEVYLCDEPALNRKVAVKVLRIVDQDAEAAARFMQEGKALAKLSHPNIVAVYGLGEHDGLLYIAMEYVQGLSLFTHSRERKLSIPEMLSVFMDYAKGLDYAHSSGLVHRDIKPANLLIDHLGRGKLIDFGIAKSVGGESSSEGVKTKTGVVIGTLNYIAPELFRGDPPSPLSDIYALGLCFFEMLTGRTPFRSESQFQTMEKIRARDIEIPENVHVLLPEEFWKILYQMVAVEPTERTATATLAVERLLQVPLHDIPKHWSAHIGTARIENLTELHNILDDNAIDLAERQFILSAALMKNQLKTPAPDEDVVDSTRLIQATGIIIPKDLLAGVVADYQELRKSLLTTRRTVKISGLQAPTNIKKSVENHVTTHVTSSAPATALGPAGTFAENGAIQPAPTGNSQITNQRTNQTPPAATGGAKWAVALALLGILVVGGLQYVRWEKEKQNQALILAAAQNAKEAAAKRQASRGEKIMAPVNQGLGLVVEPSSDPWTPIEWATRDQATATIWNWKAKASNSQREMVFQEKRTSLGTDPEFKDLQKYRVETSYRESDSTGKGTEKIVQKIGFEWFRNGYIGLPVRSSASPLHGTIGATIVGEPERIFPLRKGKEVQFETELQTQDEIGLFPIFSNKIGKSIFPKELKLRVNCITGDQIDNVVTTDCSYRAVEVKDRKIEFTISTSWSVFKNDIISQSLRLVSTTNDNTVEVYSLSGEQFEQEAVRLPAKSSEALN